MKKNRTKRLVRKAPKENPQPRLIHLAITARDSLRELCINTGLQVLSALLEEDRERLVGPARKKNEERENYRYGSDRGSVVLGGRKVSVSRPRVRSTGGKEVQLATWEQFTHEDPLDDRAYEQMVLGVSTRRWSSPGLVDTQIRE